MEHAKDKRQTANVNLYHVTKFHLHSLFTVHCVYTEISIFMPVSLKKHIIVLDSFSPLISLLRNSELESDGCR